MEPLLSDADKQAVTRVLRQALSQNYDKRNRDRSGTLRKAVEASDVAVTQSADEVEFTATLADLTRPPLGKEKQGVPVRIYAPVVFSGRAVIRQSTPPVIFNGRPATVSAAGQTRNPYVLDEAQQDAITATLGAAMADAIIARNRITSQE